MKNQIGTLEKLKPQEGDRLIYIGEGDYQNSPTWEVNASGRLVGLFSGFPLSKDYYEGGCYEHKLFKIIPRGKVEEKPKRMPEDVYQTIYRGEFYDDYAQSSADLRILKEKLVSGDKLRKLEDKVRRNKAKQKALHAKFGDVYKFMLNNC